MEQKCFSSGLFCLIFTLISAADASVNVVIDPVHPVVRYGQPLDLNCTTDCQEIRDLGFETSLPHTKENGSKWIAIHFVSVTEWELSPLCYVNCNLTSVQQFQSRSQVLLFAPPEAVFIKPLPVMEVSKPYDLICTVPDVHPVSNLTVKLLRSNITFYAAPHYIGPAGRNILHVVYSIIPETADNGMNYTCLAELDLRPHGGIYSASSTVTLKTFAFPQIPKIIAPSVAEATEETTVKCEIRNVFPPENLKVILKYEDEELNSKIIISGHNVLAEATLSSAEEGRHMLTCNATIEYKSKNVSSFIHIYVLPEPVINLYTVEAGSAANISCSVTGEKIDRVKINLIHNKEHLEMDTRGSYIFRAQKEDNNNLYTCETELKVDEHTLKKNKTGILNVLYAPVINKTVTMITAVINSSASLTCQATGNPSPRITWARDENEVAAAASLILNDVSKNDSGMYQCTATNSQGEDSHMMSLDVEYPPEMPTITVTSSENTRSNITIVCSADSIPAAVYKWTYPLSHNVQVKSNTILITEPTHINNGEYSCEAENKHGTHRAEINLEIPRNRQWILGICIAAGVVTMVILLLMALVKNLIK